MKKLISVFLLLALLLSLTACHGKQEQKVFEIPAEFDTSRNYEITFWAKNDTNMTQVQIYKDAIAGFEKMYPNVKVNLRLYTDYGRIYNDVITNIATATTPNVCITYPDHIATYLTGRGTMASLDELMTDSKYGYRATEDALSVSLINTSCYPDPFPDRGLHTVNIALAVGRDDPRELEDTAGFYNHPAYFCSGWSHPGELPMSDSFLELEAASTVLSAVLPTGNRDTILERYYETAGQDDHIALHFGRPPVSAAATDLSGCWADSNAAIVGDTVLVTAKAHSIGQLRITF